MTITLDLQSILHALLLVWEFVAAVMMVFMARDAAQGEDVDVEYVVSIFLWPYVLVMMFVRAAWVVWLVAEDDRLG